MKRMWKEGYARVGLVGRLLLGTIALASLCLPPFMKRGEAACNVAGNTIIDVKIIPAQKRETQVAVDNPLRFTLTDPAAAAFANWSVEPVVLPMGNAWANMVSDVGMYVDIQGGTAVNAGSDQGAYTVKCVAQGSGNCSNSVPLIVLYSTANAKWGWETVTGDPINVADGAAISSETDIYIPCPVLPLSFERSYSSRHDVYIRSGNMNDTNTLVAPLGAGWTHNYDWYVERRIKCTYLGDYADEWLLVHAGNGETFWIRGGEGSSDPRYEMKVLWRNSTSGSLECHIGAAGGLEYDFDTNGILTVIKAPDDITLSCSYEGTYPNHRLTNVTHSANNRTLNLSYEVQNVGWAKPDGSNGVRSAYVLSEVSSAGLSVKYNYTIKPDGDSDPDEMPLLTKVTRETRYQVQETTYDYSSAGRGVFALSVRKNPEGHTFEYDYENHVMPSEYTTDDTAWATLARAASVAVNPGGFYDMKVDYANGRSGKAVAKSLRPQRPIPTFWEETWELNEGIGNTVTGQPNGAQGTVYGAVWTNGVKGKALFFDGVTNYAVLSSGMTGVVENVNISVFVRHDTPIGDIVDVVPSRLIAGDPTGLGLGRTASNYWFGIGPSQSASIPIPPNPDTNWVHLLGIHAGNQLKLYYNGNLVASSSIGTTPSPPQLFVIGGYDGKGYFRGAIDEVFVSGRNINDESMLFSLANGNTPDYLTSVYQVDTARHYLNNEVGPFAARQRINGHDAGLNLASEMLVNTNTGLSLLSERTYDGEHHPLTETLTYSGGITGVPATVSMAWNSDFDIPSKITDALERSVEYGIENGRVTSISDGIGTTTYTYTDHVLSRIVNANGHYVATANNPYGYATNIVPQLGPPIVLERDAFGNVTSLSTPGLNGVRTTTFDVDELGRVWQIDYPLGVSEQFLYDKIGNVTNHIDPLGRRTEISYAPTRVVTRIVQDAGGLAATNTFSYTEQFDALKITDAMGRAVEAYTLDTQRRPIVVTNLEAQSMSISYEHEDLVDSVTRFDGTQVSFDYDKAARRARTVYPGNQVTEYRYYANGLPSQVADASGSVSFDYDNANRLTAQTAALSVPCVTSVVSYSYFPAGQVSNVTSIAGATTYSLDAADRVSSIQSPVSSFEFQFNPTNGLLSAMTCTNAGVTASYDFDDLDRVTNIVWRDSATNTLRSFAYSYNNAGMITGVTQADGTIRAYEYDGLDRLVSETLSGAATSSCTFAYDLAGNRTQTVADNVTNTYTLGLGNRLASWGTSGAAYYSDAGCATTIIYSAAQRLDLAWNAQYQLTEVKTNGTSVERNGFDALGRRVWNWDGIETNYFVYDGQQVIAEVDATGGLRRAYVWGPGIDNLLAMTVYTGATAKTYFPLTDHLGSIHALVDQTGAIVESYKFDSWGRVLGVYDSNNQQLANSATGLRYLWQGREYSWKTGLYNFRARWYDPVTGRWLSNDPIGISGGLNQYVFCGNNPVMFTDAFGLAASDWMHWNVLRSAGQGAAQGAVAYGKGVAIGAAGAAVVAGAAVGAAAVGVPAAIITGGLVIAGGIGGGAVVYSTGRDIRQGNWNGVSYDIGAVVGGSLVGIGSGRAMAQIINGKPSPAWNWRSDWSQRYDPNYPGGSIPMWWESGPNPGMAGGAAAAVGAGAAQGAKTQGAACK